jgi:hypothetical protein
MRQVFATIVALTFLASATTFAKTPHHCVKNKKEVAGRVTKAACHAAGGKWVKTARAK